MKVADVYLSGLGVSQPPAVDATGEHVGRQCTAPGMAVHHATKWGVEGFFGSLAAEVKRFGIGVTIAEPGAVRADFTGRSKEMTAALPAYRGARLQPSAARLSPGSHDTPGDLAKMAAAYGLAQASPRAGPDGRSG